jgi:Fe-S-cluster containining protein
MKIDFQPFFKKYQAIVTMADEVFEKIQKEFPENVTCKIKCADCCHALFDITLIEAIYINDRFNTLIKGEERERLIARSNQADRKVYKIKRKAYKDKRTGKNDMKILVEMAAERVRCPLLNDEDFCSLYENRPITCRLYGIPTSTNGISHTCGKSDFVEGKQYPTVNLDIIQQKLFEISSEFVLQIKTKYTQMAEMLVPVSMAILTQFDEDYLGVSEPEKDES